MNSHVTATPVTGTDLPTQLWRWESPREPVRPSNRGCVTAAASVLGLFAATAHSRTPVRCWRPGGCDSPPTCCCHHPFGLVWPEFE